MSHLWLRSGCCKKVTDTCPRKRDGRLPVSLSDPIPSILPCCISMLHRSRKRSFCIDIKPSMINQQTFASAGRGRTSAAQRVDDA